MIGNTLIVTVKNLPKPVKFTTVAYFSCVICYNIYGTYFDCKEGLTLYRNNQWNEKWSKVNNEWEAMKYVSKSKFGDRLWSSIIWPITVVSDIVPSAVLALNPKKPA